MSDDEHELLDTDELARRLPIGLLMGAAIAIGKGNKPAAAALVAHRASMLEVVVAMLQLCDSLGTYYGADHGSLVFAAASEHDDCDADVAELFARAMSERSLQRVIDLLADAGEHLPCYLVAVSGAVELLMREAPEPTLMQVPDDASELS